MPIDRNHPLVGLKVVYTPNYGPSEEGVVTSVNEELGYVFVSYGNSSTSKASVPDRLTDMSGRRVRL